MYSIWLGVSGCEENVLKNEKQEGTEGEEGGEEEEEEGEGEKRG